MTITIPIRPHLKKFILKCYQSKKSISVREDDKIVGKSIMAILIDKRGRKNSVDNYNSTYTSTLEIELSEAMAERSPSIKKLVHLNDEIDDLFKQCLYIWVHSAASCGVNPYNATKGFVEYYNFDEKEYTHDAAYRAWLRYKNNEYKRNKKTSIVS